jgi:hypothetical protein
MIVRTRKSYCSLSVASHSCNKKRVTTKPENFAADVPIWPFYRFYSSGTPKLDLVPKRRLLYQRLQELEALRFYRFRES